MPNGSMVFSDFIPVGKPGRYTYSCYIKTSNGPTTAGLQIAIFGKDKQYLRNITSGRIATSADEEWQECAISVFIPEEAAYLRTQVYKMENTRPGGQVWADDFYWGKGVGLEQPPTPKQGFAGAHVRVDELGNFEVKKNGRWTPFFPLCMYADNLRDWSLYSRQGWNVNIWTGAASQIKRAREAISEFNPDGMMVGFQISQYTFPSGWAYNDLEDLRSKVQEIFSQGLADNLLFYYWDNENNHDQWKVPSDVINTIRSIDVDASGNLLHPVYALQGTYNSARVHAAHGLVDVAGTYVGGGSAAAGGAGMGDYSSLFFLDRLQHQSNPAAIAQFNGVDGPGEMRLRLYSSLILGAKGIGYWADRFNPATQDEFPTVGPVDKKDWWPDFPNLRREVDKLLPLIREPHWTKWKARLDKPGQVNLGTRDHQGAAHIILVNQSDKAQTVTVSLEGLPYTTCDVLDYFDGKKITTAKGKSFTITLPAIGIDSGSEVFRLLPR